MDVKIEPSVSEFRLDSDISSNLVPKIGKSQSQQKKKSERLKSRNTKHRLDIWGVRRDGFDIYKPSKKLKCINLQNKAKQKAKIYGILERKVSKLNSVSKNRLFKEVFLEDKKAEVNRIEFEHLQKYPPDVQERLRPKKEPYEIHNTMVRKEFMKTTIVKPTGE